MERSSRASRETSNCLHVSLSEWNPDDPQRGKHSWKRVQLLSGDFEVPQSFNRCFDGICAVLEAGQANLWGDGRRPPSACGMRQEQPTIRHSRHLMANNCFFKVMLQNWLLHPERTNALRIISWFRLFLDLNTFYRISVLVVVNKYNHMKQICVLGNINPA